MTYKYDFDIHWIISRDQLSGQKTEKFLGDVGKDANATTNYVALFRDPSLVDALQDVDESFKKFLTSSGFGFTVFDSGAPSGRYPAQDEGARDDVIAKLAKNLPNYDLKSLHMNGFDWTVFLNTTIKAEPFDMGAPQAVQAAPGTTIQFARLAPKPTIDELEAQPISGAASTGIRAAVVLVVALAIGYAFKAPESVAAFTATEFSSEDAASQ